MMDEEALNAQGNKITVHVGFPLLKSLMTIISEYDLPQMNTKLHIF